jgi:hypothetical protein
MLGEGFDLPELKIAAIHDPQKSLAVTLQFIGRFTRSSGERLGEASAFVPLQAAGIDHRFRRLYGEDADWNQGIQDLTEHAVDRERQRTDFEQAFGSLPIEVAMRSVHPKKSTVVYRSGTAEWNPEAVYDLFEGQLLTKKLGINNRDRVAWWVSEEATPVRWGEFPGFSELVHNLYVVFLDQDAGFLYINSTNNDSLHESIAKAVGGAEMDLLKGESVYRVLSAVNRRIPTNVGMLDAVSRTRRFSMHVGQDVLSAWRGEGGTKLKTNIFVHGFRGGRAVSYGASRKGRVWSHEEARDIHDWVQWAAKVGPLIVDESISLDSVMAGFLLPQAATERPNLVPLAIEFPYQLISTLSDTRWFGYRGEEFPLLDCELTLQSHEASGPLIFEVATPGWALGYEFDFHEDRPPTIRPLGDDALVRTSAGVTPLSSFLSATGLYVLFEGEATLMEDGLIVVPNREKRLWSAEEIEVADWSGIDLTCESQGAERDPSTIQFRAIEVLADEDDWEVILDDDGKGELADVVLMKRDGEELETVLVHCKYSTAPTPGHRIGDLYDVCGQAMKMNRAKSFPDLLTHRLHRREINRQKVGRSGLIHGDAATFTTIVKEARYRHLKTTVVIVQPGISRAEVTDDMRALLGGVDRFLADTYGMKLRVIGSA